MTDHGKDWYFSRGDAELYDKCPRARFHRTIGHTGRGIVKVGSSFEQSLGRIIHRACEWVLLNRVALGPAAGYAASAAHKLVSGGEIPRKVPAEYHEQFLNEAEALAGGLVWAWGLFVLPDIRANYTVIAAEEQTAYRKDGLVMPTVADLLLESKDDETLVYPDWKTAAWVNPDWMEQWSTAAQLHTTAKAIEQVMGREVEYCYVQALVKGRWQNGYQQSPLCWAYFNEKFSDPKNTDPEWSFKYKAGKKWRRTAPWLEGIPTEEWVKMIPREVAGSIVPRTPPIIVNPHLADTWWRQHAIKERQIRDAKTFLTLTSPSETERRHVMDRDFPQDFTQCRPVIGHNCDYQEICHDPHGIGADPIGSGQFKRRPTYAERLKEESADELRQETGK